VSVSPATRKVLVLGEDDRSFLTVIRSLGRAGLQVHVAWCPSDAAALRSRYVARVHELPRYARGDDAWVAAFADLCRRERFDLVIPCNDPTLVPLALERAALAPLVRLALPGEEAFAVAFDKRKSHELAGTLGIPVPRELRFAAPVDAAAVLSAFRLPVVLKPRRSFAPEDPGHRRQVRVASDPEALARHLRAAGPGDEILVQEYFRGTGVGVEVLADDGEVLVAFQHVRVHELPAGSSSYRRSAPLAPELRDAAARLMLALRYTGVAMIEFRVDAARGEWVFLEINGRFWGSLPLAVAAGADFPYYLYQLLVEGRRDFPQRYAIGLYCRNWLRDLDWLRTTRRLPPAERAQRVRVLPEIARLLTLRERCDTLVMDDPRPALVEIRDLARSVAARGRRALTAVPVLRRLRGARARRALGQARTVLFVCKGNVCRSPFAQAYAQARLANGTTALSSGYYPKAGRPCPAEAVEVAREMGVDLVAHRSSVLGEAQVRAADAIFVFDEENYRTLTARHPRARRKIHRLGDLAADGPAEIRDPYGGTREEFRAAYQAIRRTLEGVGTPVAPPT